METSRRGEVSDQMIAATEPTHKGSGAARVKVSSLEANQLARELRNAIRGEVRFDEGARSLYATDSSNYRQVPIGVVLPRDRSDVIATVELCRKHGAPITGRGGGTSLA